MQKGSGGMEVLLRPGSHLASVMRRTGAEQHWRGFIAALLLWAFGTALTMEGVAAEKFTLATYNLENYVVVPGGSRPVKSAQSRAKIRESIRAMRPDVLGLQEIGNSNALLELRAALKSEGLDYPHWEHVSGFDTNIQVAVLSRFPIVARRPHSNEGFLLKGRRLRTSRGIAEVEIRVNEKYAFTLFVAHLKSRSPSAVADQADLREQEALVLRELVEARLKANPDGNVAVVGDLNDVKNSPSTRAVIGKGKLGLADTRPAERAAGARGASEPPEALRKVVWTHFYGVEDTYSRVDYILLSRGMAREWDVANSYVLAMPNWGMASDHRPVIVSFTPADR
ncbi:MAG: endonuclease/exonuclease/phosphatase family protein [Verrucomicrobiia bacterium]